jgi:hypothetical protein
MGRISRGIELIKIGFSVIGRDKEILLLPFAAIVIIVMMLIPIFAILFIARSIALFVFSLIIFYILAFFTITFFEAAVIECARVRLQGGDPKATDGIKKAWNKKGPLFIWSIVRGTVNLILSALEERFGKIFRIFAEVAWRVATLFVIPVLLYEKLGIWDSTKRSVELLKKSWGEIIVTGIGTGTIFFLLGLIGLIPILIGYYSGSFVVFVCLLLLSLLYWFVLCIINSAVRGVIISGLYLLAKGEKVTDRRLGNIKKAISSS